MLDERGDQSPFLVCFQFGELPIRIGTIEFKSKKRN